METSMLIKSLSVHQRYWTITALLSDMDPVRPFKSGQGNIQKLTLMDKEGCRIYAIMFNETIDKFKDVLQKGRTYIFSNGQIKSKNHNFYNVHDKFEIILNNTSHIALSDDDSIASMTLNLSTIEDIKRNPNSPSDIILVVIKVYELRSIYRHSDKQRVLKRDLQVVALRSEVITLTLWESLANIEGQRLEDIKNENPIILVRSVVGKIYNGFILSTTVSTTIEVNPDIPASKDILTWFNEQTFQPLTSTFDDDRLTTLDYINTCNHSSGEVKYYSTTVLIKAFNQEGHIWYNSCNTCKSKITIDAENVRCFKCSKENVEYSLRYLLKVNVEDDTSTAILNIFDKEAEQLLGLAVTDLKNIKERDIDEYVQILDKCLNKKITCSVKSQDRLYNNRSFRSLTVQSINMSSEYFSNVESKRIKLEPI